MSYQPRAEQIASSVAKELFEAFERLPGAKNIPSGTLIYQQEDSPDAFYFLRKGKIRVYVSSPQGGEKTLSVCRPGEIFGQASFFDRRPRMSCAAALENSTVITVGRDEVLSLFSANPKLALSVIEYLSRTVRILSGQVESMSFLPTDKRIARYLLESVSGPVFQTHEQIGRAVGASRVTVSRIMSRFTKEGWIRCSYGATTITDPESLMNFCKT